MLGDLWGLVLRERKKWWLLPMVIVLLIFGALIVLTSGAPSPPSSTPSSSGGGRVGGERPTMRTKSLTREKVLETTGVFALASLVVSLLARRPGVKGGFLAAAAAPLVAGLFVRPAGRLVAAAWMKFAEVVGAVNSRILLGAIFYLFLTPIAFLARLVRGDLLNLARKRGPGRTYWLERGHAYTRADLEKIW